MKTVWLPDVFAWCTHCHKDTVHRHVDVYDPLNPTLAGVRTCLVCKRETMVMIVYPTEKRRTIGVYK